MLNYEFKSIGNGASFVAIIRKEEAITVSTFRAQCIIQAGQVSDPYQLSKNRWSTNTRHLSDSRREPAVPSSSATRRGLAELCPIMPS